MIQERANEAAIRLLKFWENTRISFMSPAEYCVKRQHVEQEFADAVRALLNSGAA